MTSSECETISVRLFQLTKFLHTSLLSLATMKHHVKPLTSSNILVKSVLQPQLICHIYKALKHLRHFKLYLYFHDFFLWHFQCLIVIAYL